MNDALIKAGKRYAREALELSHLPAYQLGALLLSNKSIRQRLNRAYEGFGAGFADFFDAAFNGSEIRASFEWRNQFAGREFCLPVYPELRRSWSNARLWRWAGNRAIRQFYELYLSYKPQGTFLDIGANDGSHSYPFAASGYTCVCFEPQETCVDYIRRTCNLNGFMNVLVERVVVNERDAEQVLFYVSDSSWFSSLIKENVERFEMAQPIQIRAVALDDYCADNGLRPDLIKIDVEGCEWQVIQGGRSTIQALKPDLLVEIHAHPINVKRFWDFFTELEYGVYFVHHYTTRPFKVMRSAEDCLAAIGRGKHGDFIALSSRQIADKIEKSQTRFALR